MSFIPAFPHEGDGGAISVSTSQPSFHLLQQELGDYEADFAEDPRDVADNPYIQALPEDVWKTLFGQPLSSVRFPVLTPPYEPESETLRKIVEEYAAPWTESLIYA